MRENDGTTKSTASAAERVIIMPLRGVHYFQLSAAKSNDETTNHCNTLHSVLYYLLLETPHYLLLFPIARKMT